MRRIFEFLNPISHLGDKRYLFIFPFLTTVLAAVLVELYVHYLVGDPEAVAPFAILAFAFLIVYFSFRCGLRGGYTAVLLTISYYLYILFSRDYSGERLVAGIQSVLLFALLYFILAGIIGWLKETIDDLIDREANEKMHLRAILDQLPVGVIVSGKKGEIMHANRMASVIAGKKIPIGAVVGRDITIEYRLRGKVLSPHQYPLMVSLKTGKDLTGKEFSLFREDGKRKYVRVNSSAVRNREGKVIGAASIIHDITSQKEIEKRKDDFVNMASHELKTPITSLSLYLETLGSNLRKRDYISAGKIVGNIRSQVQRLQGLVNDLLDVSRLQTGKLVFNMEGFRIDELVEESISPLRRYATKNKINFSKKPHVKVYADRFRIYQVITNLVTNAVKYSKIGKSIDVVLEKSGSMAVISIRDSGLGIAKSEQRKIFNRLYQSGDSKGKTFGGFGMGLYISKEIIRRHGGKIWVESERGKGSIFYFSLPLV